MPLCCVLSLTSVALPSYCLPQAIVSRHYAVFPSPSTMSISPSSHHTRESSTDAKVTKTKQRKRTSFLTEEQKKKHHIESEHKRRQAIRDAFLKLTDLVPALKAADARSEILVLDRSAEYLASLYRENLRLVSLLDQSGVPVRPSRRIPFPNGEPPEPETNGEE